MTRTRPIEDLAATMAWAPLEQYVPTLTASVTNPTGQTVTGRCRRRGVHAYVSGVATLGAGLGTGEYRVSLPSGWAAATITGMRWTGGGAANDVSTGISYKVTPLLVSGATLLGLTWVNGTTSALQAFTSTSPIALAAGDYLVWHIWFELDSA